MFREICVTSKVSIAFRTRDCNTRECARATGHAVAKHLVAGFLDVTCTCLLAHFTHELSSHVTCKTCDHVIMSFDIVIQYIKSFSGVHLPFKNDVFAAQTAVDNYLILPKVYLETD